MYKVTKTIKGIELENRVIDYWKDQIQIEKSLSKNDNNFDLITAFHLLEHILTQYLFYLILELKCLIIQFWLLKCQIMMMH